MWENVSSDQSAINKWKLKELAYFSSTKIFDIEVMNSTSNSLARVYTQIPIFHNVSRKCCDFIVDSSYIQHIGNHFVEKFTAQFNKFLQIVWSIEVKKSHIWNSYLYHKIMPSERILKPWSALLDFNGRKCLSCGSPKNAKIKNKNKM
jgi:hypothetical protein